MSTDARARLQALGSAFQPSVRSNVGKIFRTLGVRDGHEFRRIAGLPRREISIEAGEALARELSIYMRTAAGTMALRPIQAIALDEMAQVGGLAAPIRVGGGKTLISLLAPLALGSSRPLLVVPAKLREKTRREFRVLAEHWHVDVIPEVLSYELLGREQAAAMLAELRPDLVILDEAHRAKNPKAAVTRRLRRYLDGDPSVRCVVMSGTLTQRSIAECAHLYEWALAERSPLPRKWADVTEWGLAIDEKLPKGGQRLDPGALRQFYGPEEARASMLDEVPAVRAAVYRRITDTPGVVGTTGGGCTATLTISLVPVDDYKHETEEAFRTIRDRWETPDGHPIADAASRWRHACEVASGFYYRWNPRPPIEWLTARREWAASVRHILDHNQRELDSELQVARAVARGDYDGATIRSNGIQIGRDTVRETYDAWLSIRDTFTPNQEAVWIDDAVIRFVREWIATGPGIVWVSQVALGEELARVLGLPYYGKKGLDERRRLIDSASPMDGSIIASIASNGEGRNLQAWSRSLVIGRPLSGGEWEQLLGRTHRDGQTADEVTIDVVASCLEHYEGFGKALDQASYAETVQGQPQKLLLADRIDPFGEAIPVGPRWG